MGLKCFLFDCISLTADGPQLAINVLGYQSHLLRRCHLVNVIVNVNVRLMPVVTNNKDLPHLSPVLAYDFYRDASSAFLHVVN